MSVFRKTADFLRLIKFSHSVFALPFAFTAAIIAAEGVPSLHQIFWITVAMVSGRSGAMGVNRITDRKIDALNPRTQNREIPKGLVKTREALLFTTASFTLMVFSAYMLNPLCLKISPLVLLVLIAYSYTKRFTCMCHVVLGLALSLAPLGAWIAIRGTFSPEILPLCLAVMFWVAGFDILYGLQDLDFDRKNNIHSIPKVFGIRASFWIARIFHIATIVLLLSLVPIFNLSGYYLLGIMIAASLLFYEHIIVRPDDLSRLNIAFFNMNGYISITVFLFTLINYLHLNL